MNYFKITLLLIGVLFTLESHAQSKDSLMVTTNCIEFDINKNYDADSPPLNLDQLQEPTLFILNDQEMEVSKFSELNLEDKKIESITLIRHQQILQRLGHDGYNSVVKVITEEEEE